MAKKTISLPIDEELLASMQTLAAEHERSRTAEIIVALKRYVAEELGDIPTQSKPIATQPIIQQPEDVSFTLTQPVVKDNKGLL